jgi:flagellar biogenesis protein FliO
MLAAGLVLQSPAAGQRASDSSAGSVAMQPTPLERVPIRPVVHGQDAPRALQVTTSQSIPLSAAPKDDSVNLSPPTTAEARSAKLQSGGGRALATMLGSLAIVLSVFFGLVWLSRRNAPAGSALLPAEVVESLGQAPLAARQQMQLIRLGNRLLLLSVHPQGAETLAEVTEPAEVSRLVGLCQQNRVGSVSETFRQILSQMSSEPTSTGFLDSPAKGPRLPAGTHEPGRSGGSTCR